MRRGTEPGFCAQELRPCGAAAASCRKVITAQQQMRARRAILAAFMMRSRQAVKWGGSPPFRVSRARPPRRREGGILDARGLDLKRSVESIEQTAQPDDGDGAVRQKADGSHHRGDRSNRQ